MAAVDLSGITSLNDQFQKALSSNDVVSFSKILSSLKMELTKLPSLPPSMEPSANAQEQRILAREILESAVLYYGNQGDDEAFDRNFALLLPYYLDMRSELPESQREPLMWGFYLLMLLVQNRIAEFHATVELLPNEVIDRPEVSQVMELEGWMMQGSYSKVLSARGSSVSPYYLPLLERMVTTVKNEIASCSGAAFTSMKVSEAAGLLGVADMGEFDAMCLENGWKKQGDMVIFKEATKEADKHGIPEADMVIDHCLQYAKELERIV